MAKIFAELMQPETLVALLFSLAAFAAVLSAAAPLMQNDPMQARMKAVSVERDRLRIDQRRRSAGESKLRDASSSGVARRIVDILRLRKVFEPEASRAMLRQAGLRSERYLVLYLVARVAVPLLLGVIAFVYASSIYGDRMPPQMRISVGVIGIVVGNYLPYVLLRNLILRRQASIRLAWPDALDLMLICVESGMAIEPAMQRVSREIGPISVPLAEELALTVAELSYLQDRRKAYENLGLRTGMPQVKSVVTSLIQSERYGTPLGTALRVLAQENRDMRMAEAERKAAALPPRLTVPMILFFMPVIFVVIGAPAAMNLSRFF